MARYRSPALRRYLQRLSVFMTLYVVLILGAGWAFRHAHPSGPIAWTLAIAPALPILGTVWTIMRLLVEEPDEYLRLLFMRQCMIATGFALTVTTVWQSLQNYDMVPPGNGGFGAAFFWFAGFGIGAIWNGISEARGKAS